MKSKTQYHTSGHAKMICSTDQSLSVSPEIGTINPKYYESDVLKILEALRQRCAEEITLGNTVYTLKNKIRSIDLTQFLQK